MNHVSRVLLPLALLGSVANAGCGSSEPKARSTVEISGTVALDGSPMPEGEIFFVNVADGVREVLPVKDGKFAGKASTGSRKVEVRSYKQAAPSKSASEMYGSGAEGSKENFLPAKYNTETTFNADIKEGAAPLEFAVTSQ